MKTGYKIFTLYKENTPYGKHEDAEEGDYLSFNQTSFGGGFIYNKIGRNYRQYGNGPLAVFDTKGDAKIFLDDFRCGIPEYVLEKVKYKPSKDHVLFYMKDGIHVEVWCPPHGTRYANWVEIIPDKNEN